MIPEAFITRFNIQKVYGVSRGEYMLAYGRPCRVANFKMIRHVVGPSPESECNMAPQYTLNIMCYDIFTAEPVCVQLTRTSPLYTFALERVEHTVLHTDDEGVLTDTEDDLFAVTPLNVYPGAILHTLAAPVCENQEWRMRRILEKISQGAPITPIQAAEFNRTSL